MVDPMSKNKRRLWKRAYDALGMLFYGWGRSFAAAVWALVALLIMNSYVPVSPSIVYVVVLCVGLGEYFFAVRRWRQAS